MTNLINTAKGIPIDMDTLRKKYEKIRAVSNCNLNGRGDIIDSTNNITQTKNQRIQHQYNQQTSTLKDSGNDN